MLQRHPKDIDIGIIAHIVWHVQVGRIDFEDLAYVTLGVHHESQMPNAKDSGGAKEPTGITS